AIPVCPVPQPAQSAATPSTSSPAVMRVWRPDGTDCVSPEPPIKRTKLSGRLARGSDLRERLVTRRVDREDAVEAGDLEDLGDVPAVADERELAVVRPEPLDAADEDSQGRRVDERRVGEVDDHFFAALPDHG